jgi:hypothetical protein
LPVHLWCLHPLQWHITHARRLKQYYHHPS